MANAYQKSENRKINSDREASVNQPYKISDAAMSWPAMMWDIEMLKMRSKKCTTTLYSYNKNKKEQPRVENMEMREALKCIEKYSLNPHQDISYYIKQANIKNFDDLMKDLRRIEVFKEKIAEINLWIGNRGASTPWHYDLLDNAIIQIEGSKTILLGRPELTKFFKPQIRRSINQDENKDFNFSTADVQELNQAILNQPRLFEKIDLKKGDIAIIPSYWWHQVECKSEVSITANYFYNSQHNQRAEKISEEIRSLDEIYNILSESSKERRVAIKEILKIMVKL